ncbi:hypothetical protein [Pseudodesulfovibrio sp. zrk46]|uniref:hypothetical protein n=1 Tax=Pseudodesulfovibrio sp. zrk46 TaxID=2725288 RepID=UPI001449F51E|nr:hypothetical protein [Pseudodesulfovibrio sp. zrk46]QJB56327.1 hypothetical protein HFN16_07835 [Pseudodesulfovibrio sp. zrk46]
MQLQPLHIVGKETSKLYPFTHSLVEQLDKKLIKLVIKWRVMGYGGKLEIKEYDGSHIYYQGITYSGSPEVVFWGSWMNDYLKNDSLSILNDVAESAHKADYDVKECVDEALDLLCIMASRIYDQMVDVDSKLRGDGVKFGKPRNVSDRKSNFRKYLIPHGSILVDKYSTRPPQKNVSSHRQDLFEAKPGVMGFRINLIEGYRRLRKYFMNDN